MDRHTSWKKIALEAAAVVVIGVAIILLVVWSMLAAANMPIE